MCGEADAGRSQLEGSFFKIQSSADRDLICAEADSLSVCTVIKVPCCHLTAIYRVFTLTYHHLVDGVHNIVHFISRDVAVIVHIVQPERP